MAEPGLVGRPVDRSFRAERAKFDVVPGHGVLTTKDRENGRPS